MPYPQKLLNPGETIALDLHPHWWYFAKAAGATLLAIVLGILVLVGLDGNTQKYLGYAVIAFLIFSVLWLIGRYSKWRTTNFVITSDRIIFRQGLIGKSGIEMPLERVNNVNFHQRALERLIGAGDLLIESGGEDGQQRFTDVRNPQRVQNLIHTQVEAKNKRRGSNYAAAGQQSGAGPVDVATQLEKLEGLLQRGSISQEEFDAQKARLISG